MGANIERKKNETALSKVQFENNTVYFQFELFVHVLVHRKIFPGIAGTLKMVLIELV